MAKPRLGFEPAERLSMAGMRSLKIVPAVFLSAVGLAAIYAGLWGEDVNEGRVRWVVIGAAVLILAGAYYWHMSRFADSVMDYGDHLEVTRGNVTQTVPLAEILAIGQESVDRHNQDWRITIFLDKPGRFGKQIAFYRRVFAGVYSSMPDPRITELKARIDRSSPTRNDRQS